MSMPDEIIVRRRGIRDYAGIFADMARFTRERDAHSRDEIWCLQHPPVFTLGLAGKEEHILQAGNIPVIRTDRGGQVTYHGPGQLIVYLMLDLSRRGLTVKRYVHLLEQALIDMCHDLGVRAGRKRGAPGVYIDDKKTAALGIRVKHGCSYHGLALNVDMDLAPFRRINPCGYAGLEVTQLADIVSGYTVACAIDALLPCLLENLGLATQIQGRSSAVPDSCGQSSWYGA